MRGLVRSSVGRRILFAALVSAMVPAAAFARVSAPVAPASGILTVCNASGARPVVGTFTYTYSTIASAGGTQTFNIAVGACAPRVFYTQGVSVTVTENVPAGYAVTAIALAPTSGGPGTETVITANTPSAGSATLTVGSGQATLTFTTSSTTGAIPCTVPNVFGLALTAAKNALSKAHCGLGKVRKVYSNIYYPGVVYSQSPPRGTVLASHAPVSLTVSLGHHR